MLPVSADAKVQFSQHNYDQMTKFLQEQTSKCSSITKLTTIGTSRGGKAIYSLEMTANQGQNQQKAHIGLIGSLQGTDIAGKELLLKLVEYLCSAYEQKDNRITNLLQTTTVHIVPAVDLDRNEKINEGDCEGNLEPKDDLSRSFYYNLTSSEVSIVLIQEDPQVGGGGGRSIERISQFFPIPIFAIMLILSKSHSLSSSFPLAKSQCQCLKSYFPVKETGGSQYHFASSGPLFRIN